MADPTKDEDVINPATHHHDDEQNPDPRQQIDPQDEILRRPSPIIVKSKRTSSHRNAREPSKTCSFDRENSCRQRGRSFSWRDGLRPGW